MNAEQINLLTGIVVQYSYEIHSDVGCGLYERVYKVLLAELLRERGYEVKREQCIPITYRGRTFDEGFRADLVVENTLIIEVKCAEALDRAHFKQITTYLKLARLPIGILVNFGAASLKGQIRRIVNGYDGPPLRKRSI